jgi:hypothetical protein
MKSIKLVLASLGLISINSSANTIVHQNSEYKSGQSSQLKISVDRSKLEESLMAELLDKVDLHNTYIIEGQEVASIFGPSSDQAQENLEIISTSGALDFMDILDEILIDHDTLIDLKIIKQD